MGRPPYVVGFQRREELRAYKDPLTHNERAIHEYIGGHPGVSTAEMADLFKVPVETVSRAIKRLSTLGWIESRPDKLDRRINRFGITMAGISAMKDHYSIIHGHEVQLQGIELWDTAD